MNFVSTYSEARSPACPPLACGSEGAGALVDDLDGQRSKGFDGDLDRVASPNGYVRQGASDDPVTRPQSLINRFQLPRDGHKLRGEVLRRGAPASDLPVDPAGRL